MREPGYADIQGRRLRLYAAPTQKALAYEAVGAKMKQRQTTAANRLGR